jgi:lysophospholipase L1-like esterase
MQSMRTAIAVACTLAWTAAGCGGQSDPAASSAAETAELLPPYLALGDSIAFGFSPNIPYTQANIDAGRFVGYPELVAAARGLALTNSACPGETSGSFIDPTQPDNGCHTHVPTEPASPYNQALKTHYSSSQLDFALAFLAAHPSTKLVTINIGGNDLLVVQDACKGDALCEVAGLPGALATLTANLNDIFATLRLSGYHGQIVALTQYANNYLDLVQLTALGSVKKATEATAAVWGVTIAHGFESMQWAALFEGQTDVCKTDLLLRDPAGNCNNHPSPKGAQVLRDAVSIVVY